MSPCFPAGYENQDYEVSARYPGDEHHTPIGWTNDPTGGSLVKMIELHPSMFDPKVEKITEWRRKQLLSGRIYADKPDEK